MGIAAYYRGNRAISAQFCRERGCSGCSACRTPKPTPRSENWGDKSTKAAADKGAELLRGCALMGRDTPSEEDLAEMIMMDSRLSLRAATDGARLALAGLTSQ